MERKNSKVKEDKNVRVKALEQFRKILMKNPKIKNVQTDDEFLLRFLRTKNFSVPDAMHLLENYLSTHKRFPRLFMDLSADLGDFTGLADATFLYVLPQTDKKGRLVLFCVIKNFNIKQWTLEDFLRYANLAFEYLSLDERSQTNGVVQVVDFREESVGFFTQCTPSRIVEFSKCWQNTFPLCIQEIYFIGLPSYAESCLQIFKIFLGEKLKGVVKVSKNWKEVSKEVGLSIFPKEFGGKTPAAQINKQYKKSLLEAKKEILSVNQMDISLKKTVSFGKTYDIDLDKEIVVNFLKILSD
ncbi:clavesin-2-like [Lutzomyia longipalpis]|uniref:clavesin-2-like n=1 Tax=Lutzomyia longipalpis TaxID=7200 RepID=UPI0024845C06|nr:clavesin-2-like [Lutzomyia longipalpis]